MSPHFEFDMGIGRFGSVFPGLSMFFFGARKGQAQLTFIN